MVTKELSHTGTNETREGILDVADHLLVERGYKKMTIEEIARHAGLGKGTVYLYFDSKEDVALSVIDRLNVRLREKLKKIARENRTASERLKTMLIERVMYRFDSARRHKTGIDELLACLRPSLLQRRVGYHSLEALIFAEVLIEGRTLRQFDFDDPYRLAEALLTATSALLPYSLSVKELGERDSVAERVSFLADLLIKGIAT